MDSNCEFKSPPRSLVSTLHGAGHGVMFGSPVTPQSHTVSARLSSLTNAELGHLQAMRKRAALYRAECVSLAHHANKNNPTFLTQRKVLVGWLLDVANEHKMNARIVHLAMQYTDYIMAKKVVQTKNWQLCLIASVLIASKCEAEDGKILLLSDWKFLSEETYGEELISLMELSILTVFKWDIILKTAAHFVDFYMECIRSRVDTAAASVNTAAIASFLSSGTVPLFSPVATHEDSTDDGSGLGSDGSESGTESFLNGCDCGEVCICSDNESRDDDEIIPAPGRNEFDFKELVYTILDFSMYDIGFSAAHAPDVVGAATIALAAELATNSDLEAEDIAVISGVKVKDFEGCKDALRLMFLEDMN